MHPMEPVLILREEREVLPRIRIPELGISVPSIFMAPFVQFRAETEPVTG